MKQTLSGHVLALVLFAVLVWYTTFSPSYTAEPLRASEAEPADAEEREVGPRGVVALPGAGVARRALPLAAASGVEEDELDWPEIIGGD